jgi:integrase
MGNRAGRAGAPNTVNSSARTREYLTVPKVERLMAAARKFRRYGHRDASMILIGFRHGLRASELCDLQRLPGTKRGRGLCRHSRTWTFVAARYTAPNKDEGAGKVLEPRVARRANQGNGWSLLD